MVRYVDSRRREEQILSLIIDSYIKESKPISSGYLCKEYKLSYSPATVRNVMVALEKKGFLSHLYTSSGRVPTEEGFRYYVKLLGKEGLIENYPVTLNLGKLIDYEIDEVLDYTLDALTRLSGYTSLIALAGRNEKLLYKGMRFILEQPEFEDIEALKHIIYALEVNITGLQNLLLNCLQEDIQIFIGEEIGCEDIANCSLIVSGLRRRNVSLALALLGPMRMNYLRATSCLYSVKNQLHSVIDDLI
ncbi:MAG: hypothetical protein GF375_06555 [Candidatus Omnitrophica bacterium]|nr:hypothetical protein [Candidatus Omnitrophota bacterium]MBD3269635.1 hypothetical protein [Candidatus Omnitrophota bacterium]